MKYQDNKSHTIKFLHLLWVTFGSILFVSCCSEKCIQTDEIHAISEIFENIFAPIVALVGILLAIPILRKKLVENHITTKLNEIQAANTEIKCYCQQLIDKYLPLTYNNRRLNKQDIEVVFSDIQKGFAIAQKTSGDVTAFMFYLKSTIQRFIKNYDQDDQFIFTECFLAFIINTLEMVKFLSGPVVPIPKSLEIIKKHLINSRSFKKNVSHNEILQYKHFNEDAINDPDSAHFHRFYDYVNQVNNVLLLRSAFQIYWSPNIVAKHLNDDKIYAPLIISPSNPNMDSMVKSYVYLFLIGYTKGHGIVDLLYSNLHDNPTFAHNIPFDTIKHEFKDNWLQMTKWGFSGGIQLEKAKSMQKECFETFSLRFDRKDLETAYSKNKRTIKRAIKDKLKVN
jgi:hypothetical protein